MAVAIFREPNRARWVGVRPGHDGTMLVASASATNNTATVYMVPAGKVLLVVAYDLFLVAAGVGAGTGYLNRAGETSFPLGRQFSNTQVGWHPHAAGSFSIPFELNAGDTVTVVSSAATLTITCAVWGLLIPA